MLQRYRLTFHRERMPRRVKSPGVVVRPAATLTLALPKTGLASVSTGTLFLADLGIPDEVYRRLGLPYRSPFGNRFWVELRVLGPDVRI